MVKKRQSSIVVMAPMNLPGGYEFEATLNDNTIKVIIPPGGVEEGDCLEVLLDDNDDCSDDSSHIDEEDHTDQSGINSKEKTTQKTVARIKSRRNESNASNNNNNNHNPIIKPTFSKAVIMKDVIPEGKWRHGLFSCVDVVLCPNSSSLLWVSLCCPWILVGQLMQRSKLNVWGCRSQDHPVVITRSSGGSIGSIGSSHGRGEHKHTFHLVLLFALFLLNAVITLAFLSNVYYSSQPQLSLLYYNVAVAVFSYSIIMLIYYNFAIRSTIRQGFTLPTVLLPDHHHTTSGSSHNNGSNNSTVHHASSRSTTSSSQHPSHHLGCLDDCLVSTFCAVCSLIQISRHTHDESFYQYQCCTKRGISSDAPDVYYI